MVDSARVLTCWIHTKWLDMRRAAKRLMHTTPPWKALLLRMCTSLLLNRRLKKWDQKFSVFNSNCSRQFFVYESCTGFGENADVVKVRADKFLIWGLPSGAAGLHICSTKQAYRDGGVLFSVICYAVDMLGAGEGFTWHCAPCRLETRRLHYRISDCICFSGGLKLCASHNPEPERWSLFSQLLWQVEMHSITVGSQWPVVSF